MINRRGVSKLKDVMFNFDVHLVLMLIGAPEEGLEIKLPLRGKKKRIKITS